MRSRGTQQGAALLVVLVMLAAVGLLAVTGAEDSQLQARMSLNSHHYEQAYNNAESSLVIAEKVLIKNLKDGTWLAGNSFDKEKGLLDQNGSDSQFDPTDRDEMMANGIEVKKDGVAIGIYVIEYTGKIKLGGVPLNPSDDSLQLDAFRVSALGISDAKIPIWAVVQSEIRLEPFL